MEKRSGDPPSTSTDAGAKLDAWTTTDTVTGLRLLGTTIEHRFSGGFDRLRVGSKPPCEIRIDDASVSGLHAVIERRGPHIVVEDKGSKNGTTIEGQHQPVFQLRAGAVIGFGAARLVAFSDRLQSIRAGLQRYLGYGDEALGGVDAALLATMRRRHLALVSTRGDDTLALARYIHDVSAGPAWPYRDLSEQRVPEGLDAQKPLLASSAYGTIVLPLTSLPKNREFLVRELASDTYHVRAVVVASPKSDLERALGSELRSRITVIAVPSLDDRRAELQRIVSETLAHHLAEAGASGMLLRPDDYAKLESRAWRRNHDELDDTVRRLVLVRKLGANQAAKSLGVSPSAISQWASKYGFKLRE